MRFGVSSLKDEQKSAQIFRPILQMKGISLSSLASPRWYGKIYVQPFCLDSFGLCVAMTTYIIMYTYYFLYRLLEPSIPGINHTYTSPGHIVGEDVTPPGFTAANTFTQFLG